MLKVKKLQLDAMLPVKKLNSAGYDFYSCEKVIIPPHRRMLISTGIAIEFPRNFVGRICDRSGMAAKDGLHVLAGIIDPSYRGPVKILLYNTTGDWKTIDAYTRIAQVLFWEIADFPIVEVDELSETERGAGGFGSTGTN